jgi:hypothetical protein
MRGGVPFADERRGINLGGSINNHNTPASLASR